MNLKELENSAQLPYFSRMAERNIIELGYLLRAVESEYGRRVATSTDFESLSQAILERTGESLSSSTLKRLWGYVTYSPVPRMATLDVLSIYLRFKNFRDFCDDLAEKEIIESAFFESKFVAVADLMEGTLVTIGWDPNRLVCLKYLGNFTFEVTDSVNSKLEKGDRFELSSIMVGYPLFIPRILRKGEYTPSYIAGKNKGISTLKVN